MNETVGPLLWSVTSDRFATQVLGAWNDTGANITTNAALHLPADLRAEWYLKQMTTDGALGAALTLQEIQQVVVGLLDFAEQRAAAVKWVADMLQLQEADAEEAARRGIFSQPKL